MSMLQVRTLSEATHQALRVRAAARGQSLSDYVAEELDRLVAVPTMAEFLERVRLREPVELGEGAAAVLRREREGRS